MAAGDVVTSQGAEPATAAMVWWERLDRRGTKRKVHGPRSLGDVEVTFGRAGDEVLASDDPGLSRVAVAVVRVGRDRWAAECRSSTNTVLVQRRQHPKTIAVLPAQPPTLLRHGDQVLIWTGAVYWALDFQLPLERTTVPDAPFTSGLAFQGLTLDPRQRPFAAALCASRLEPSAYEADTTRNEELAVLLSGDNGAVPSRGALDVRYHRLRAAIERQLRERSVGAGFSGQPATFSNRVALADFLVSNAVVTRSDLALLRPTND